MNHAAPFLLENTAPTLTLALSGGAISAIVIVAAVVLIALWWIATYNGLVRKKQSCKESWADIDAELKRRHDLIPNLVNTVKGYAAQIGGTCDAN